MDFSKIKNFAKTQIKARFGNVLLLTVAVMVVSGLAGSTYIGAILAPVFALSLIQINIAVLAGRDAKLEEIFSGFKNWWGAIKVYFFQGLFTSLWSLIFVIPGIVKACAYSQAMYIMGLDKSKGALQCLRESEQLMKGHKMRFFMLQLSFIGWWLLVGITFGIAAIWVVPYYNATMATFYIDIMPSTSDDSDASASQQPAHTSTAAPHRPITFGNKGEGDSDSGNSNKF